MGRLAPDWWTRGVTVGSGERPFLGSFQKGGGARNGAEQRAEPRSIKDGHARGAPSSSWISLLLFASPVCSLLVTVDPQN